MSIEYYFILKLSSQKSFRLNNLQVEMLIVTNKRGDDLPGLATDHQRPLLVNCWSLGPVVRYNYA